MKEFFAAQIDYIYFVYGFTYFLLAWLCYVLYSRQKAVLPWAWLGLFGLLHGISTWSNLVVLSLGINPALEVFRATTAVISFLFLIEFGRRSVCKSYCLWIYPALLGLAILGLLIAGLSALNTVLHYILGVTGGLWVSLVILRSSKNKDLFTRRLFRAAGVIILLYSLTHVRLFGFSIQLVRAFLSLCLVMVFWMYRYFSESTDAAQYQAKISRYFAIAALAFIAVLLAGFFITDSVGAYYRDRSRDNLLVRAGTIASILNQERINSLTATPADIPSENYIHLKGQLIAAQKVNRDCRFLYLMGIKNKQVFFIMDSLPVSDKDYSPPGEIFNEASARLLQSFSSGEPFVEGPVTDRWGEWISALTPLKDPATGKVVAVFGMDIDARIWRQNIFDHRIIGILASLILLIGFFIVLQLIESSFTKIAAAQTRFDTVVREMGDGVIICSPDFVITGINPAAEKYLGITGAQNLNLLEHIFGNFSLSISKEDLIDTAVAHKNFDIIRQETERFKALYLETHLDMLKSLTGEVSAVVFSLRDVTEARQEDIMKQNFLSLISHKLRTPTTVISANAGMLQEEWGTGALNAGQKETLAAISKQSAILANLIDKLLKFVQISSARPDTSKQELELSGYLAGLIRPMIDKIKDKRIELNIECKDVKLRINKSSLETIIKNLVENAVKFNDKEAARIDIRVRSTPGKTEISVSDNGPGILPEEQEKIFGKFYQAEKYFTGQIEGAGLGLALVRQLVEACAGKVDLKSEISKGTTFILTFPS